MQAPQPPSSTWPFLGAVAVSTVLHLALIAFLLSRPKSERTAKEEPPPAKTVYVSFQPPTPAESPPEPEISKPEEPRFARTQKEQSGPAAPTNLRGEFETQATSERQPTSDAPDRPAQDGEEPLHKDQVDTVESQAQDGEIRPDPSPTAAAPPPAPESVVTPPQQETKPSEEPPPEETAEVLEEVQKEKAEQSEENSDLETAQKISSPAEVEETVEETTAAAQEKPIDFSPPRPRVPVSQDPAFRENVSKNKIEGAIGRVGDRSAQDVRATPLGKYEAEISRIIEQEWRVQSNRYRDLIVPGILRIQFFVGPDGRVSNVNFLETLAGGTVQQGFTLGAVMKADLPPMPQEVVAELGNRPLEAVYNFHF